MREVRIDELLRTVPVDTGCFDSCDVSFAVRWSFWSSCSAELKSERADLGSVPCERLEVDYTVV